MENLKFKSAEHEGHLHPAISLFLRWFLLKETLAKDEIVANLLSDMDKGRVHDEGGWAESIRRSLLPHVLGVLSGILERPLKPEELKYVFEKVDEFIDHYGMDSRPFGGPYQNRN